VAGGAAYEITTLFGNGATGPIVMSAALLAVLAVALIRRQAQASPAPATS
jgi:hypothetical protein